MIELKAVHACDVYDEYSANPYKEAQVYLKSEADKVIAELKAQKDAKILALNAEVFKQKHHAKLFFDERNYAETQLRHHKYKRCMAMADKCVDLCHKAKDLYRWAEDENLEHHYNHKIEFFARWHKRWIKIAEKFKVAK